METQSITVLAVDDDSEDLHLMQRYLKGLTGYDVAFKTCDSGANALATIATEKLDLLFLDYVLRDATGLDILKQVRDSGDERPVIILTGQGDEAIAAECLKHGANDYIVKRDLNSDVLRHTIENVFRQHGLKRQNALLEEELQEARKMESIATLAGGLAHDFNNLLTAMMGETSLAISRTQDAAIQRHLSRVNDLGTQMTEQIRKLMDFSQRRRQPTGFISMRKLLDGLAVMLDHTIPKNILVDLRIEEGEQYVFADESAMQQIIMNLVTNARDAIEDTGRIRIHIGGHEQEVESGTNRFVAITISDNGCGIDPDIQARIFDPFFTTKELSSRKGTGLGLALVWQLVESYGGAVSFESELGAGTAFRVLLPAGQPDAAGKTPAAAESAPADVILVVDDEEVLRIVTCDLLEHLGYHTLSAGDGFNAVETYRKHHQSISLVLLDIAMPNMNGIECIKQLREIDPDVRVIFASGHDMEIRQEELTELGAWEIVQKPFQMKDLAQRIRKVLNDVPAA